MKKQLRKPENWQDFESLCKVLWGEIWNCPEIKKNGRTGQTQHGVDVYGTPQGETEYYGIQCKGKDDYIDAELSFLSNTDNASVALRKLLLESCNLHTVLDLPGGTFTGAGVKTVVLFFEKGSATKKVWFYQLNLDRNLGKINALNEKDLEEFITLQKTKGNSENSWSIDINDIDQTTFDLSAKNPNKKEESALRQPKEILEEMKA